MAERALKFQKRDDSGSTSARRLRAEGKIPAVLYGHGTGPQSIAVDAKAFSDLLHKGGRTSLITLQDGSVDETALVRDVQIDPVSRRTIHADLQRVSANESVHAKLPVVTVGVALGVKDSGGVMDVILHEIEVEGPANKLPDHIEIDVSELGIHDHATASDIVLPAGIRLVTPPDTLVVSIEPSKTAQAVEDAAAATAPEQAQPEVIGGAPEEGASE